MEREGGREGGEGEVGEAKIRRRMSALVAIATARVLAAARVWLCATERRTPGRGGGAERAIGPDENRLKSTLPVGAH